MVAERTSRSSGAHNAHTIDNTSTIINSDHTLIDLNSTLPFPTTVIVGDPVMTWNEH